MTLADDYRRQRAWRSFDEVLDALGPLEGKTVLDLGCGTGDVAAELVQRGARVTAVDGDEALLAEARSLHGQYVRFVQSDLRVLPELGWFDVVWCSFAAAYFPDLTTQLPRFLARLRAGGCAAFVEMDDLFGHEPLASETRALLDDYACASLTAARYDFHMGHKLAERLASAGLVVVRTWSLPDRELSFDGAAEPDVLAAWDARLARMTLLQRHCGARFDALRADLLACLASPLHRSRARVVACLAITPAA